MASWKERALIDGDVVYFRYAAKETEMVMKEVFVWDLDKTYLDTTFDSLSSLIRTVVERAFNKKNVPGTKALLLALSHSWKKDFHTQLPLYFITASPPQMEERISEKFSFDEMKPFGSFYKDNLKNLHPQRLWRLNKQVGYKIQALLQLRLKLHPEVKQSLFGDDSESDAVIYNLYSDICARRIGPQELRSVLRSLNVTYDQIDQILNLQSLVPEMDPVKKIYINLAVDTDTDYYLKFGRRTLPTYNAFQMAVDLFQDLRVNAEGVAAVATDMIYNYGFTPDEILRSFEDLLRRKLLGQKSVAQLIPFLTEKGLFPAAYQSPYTVLAESLVENNQVIQLEGQFEDWIQKRVDYIHDYR